MSTITSTRRAYKDTGSTTDNTFIKIVLKDGEVLRYTDAQNLITTSLKNVNGIEVAIAPVTYKTLSALNVSAIGGSSGQPSQVDLEGVLIPLGYTREQIADGVFSKATISVFISNRHRLVEDEEKLFAGFWGESSLIDGRYVTKFTSLLEVFNIDTTRVISQTCDTELGSNRCGVKMATIDRLDVGAVYNVSDSIANDAKLRPVVSDPSIPYVWFELINPGVLGNSTPLWDTSIGGTTPDGEVIWRTIPAKVMTLPCLAGQVGDRFIDIDGLIPDGAQDEYVNGRLEFISGVNKGASFIILDNSRDRFTLNLSPLSPTSLGDLVRVTMGCRKDRGTCVARYNNGHNFQGFYNIPGKINIFQIGEN